jgi:DNA-directed RNA polymerase alpha subunit
MADLTPSMADLTPSMAGKISIADLTLEKEGEKLSFDLIIKNSNLSFGQKISALFSKILISQVETWAFDRIEIYINESSYADETIALHLGLLPLYPLKEVDHLEPFEMAITAPTDMAVKSDNFSIGPNWLLLTPKYPICILEKGKTLMLRAWPALGKGSDHSKWSPVVALAASQKESEKNGVIRFRYRMELTGRLDHNVLLERAFSILDQRLQYQ